jgi:hypothetical protein
MTKIDLIQIFSRRLITYKFFFFFSLLAFLNNVAKKEAPTASAVLSQLPADLVQKVAAAASSAAAAAPPKPPSTPPIPRSDKGGKCPRVVPLQRSSSGSSTNSIRRISDVELDEGSQGKRRKTAQDFGMDEDTFELSGPEPEDASTDDEGDESSDEKKKRKKPTKKPKEKPKKTKEKPQIFDLSGQHTPH